MVYDPDLIKNRDLFNNVSSDITCSICDFIVIQPKICCSCQKSFCTECLNQWTARSKSCPFKCKDFKIGEASRIIKNILEALEFVCKKCDQTFLYSSYPNHIKTCDSEKKNCPLCQCKTIPKEKLGIIEDFNKNLKENAFLEEDLYIAKLQREIKELVEQEQILIKEEQSRKNESFKILRSEPVNEIQVSNNIDKNFPISFTQSGTYKYSQETAGTNKLVDIKDASCMKGICTDIKGTIIFEFSQPLVISAIEIGGYSGKEHFWNRSNGQGATISISINKNEWNDLGKLPSSYGAIQTISFNNPKPAKFLRFSSTLFIGIGYLKVIPNENTNSYQVKESLAQKNNNQSNGNSHSQILCYSECKLFYKKGILIGTDDISSLEISDITNKNGICLDSPGKIVFELYEEMEIKNVKIGGYAGDTMNWYCENGVGANIDLSLDEVNYTNFGKIPYGFGSSSKIISGNPTRARFVKISSNNFIGIGYLKFNI